MKLFNDMLQLQESGALPGSINWNNNLAKTLTSADELDKLARSIKYAPNHYDMAVNTLYFIIKNANVGKDTLTFLSQSKDRGVAEKAKHALDKLEESASVDATNCSEQDSIGSLIKYMEPVQEQTAIGSFEQLEQLMEALKGSRVNCFIIAPKDVPELKDDVFAIKNESEVVDFLVTLLGIPRDGTSYKIRTGFMAYDEQHKVLFFSKNKYDLPAYLGKRPAK